MTNLEVELKKLRKAAGEAVRRGIEYADWESEVVPLLSNRDGDPPDRLDQTFAVNICLAIWRDACASEGLAFDSEGLHGAGC